MTVTMERTRWGWIEWVAAWTAGLCALVASAALCKGLGLSQPLTLLALAVVGVAVSPLTYRTTADPGWYVTAVLVTVGLVGGVAVLAVLAAGWAGLLPLLVLVGGIAGPVAAAVVCMDAARRMRERIRR